MASGDNEEQGVYVLKLLPGPQGPPGPSYEEPRWYNVRELGAKGDGKADDTEAFERAIELAKPGACGYDTGTVFVPAGRYKITRELVIKDRISIIGRGHQSQVWQSSQENLFHFVGPTGPAHIQGIAMVSAAKWDQSGDPPKPEEAKAALRLDAFCYVTLRDCYINGGHYSIYAHGCLGLHCDNVRYAHRSQFFGACDFPWAYVYADTAYSYSINAYLFENLFIQQGYRGVVLNETAAQGSVKFLRCTIEGLKREGIHLKGFTTGFSIDTCHLESQGSNVRLESCGQGGVTNCYVGAVDGIVMKRCRNITVEGNYASKVSADKDSWNTSILNNMYGGYANAGSLEAKGQRVYGLLSNATWRGSYTYQVDGRIVSCGVSVLKQSQAPSVAESNTFRTENKAATTISDFADGLPGQAITVIFGDSNTKIDFSGKLRGNQGKAWSPKQGDHLTAVYDGEAWYCMPSQN
jgi:hypothetical protein